MTKHGSDAPRVPFAEIDLDPGTRTLVTALLAARLLPGDFASAPYIAAWDEFLVQINGTGPTMHQVLDVDVSLTASASVNARIFQPIGHPIGTVVFFGGGWGAGAIRHMEPVISKLAERTSCTFALVDAHAIWNAPAHRRQANAGEVLSRVLERAELLTHAAAPVVVAGDGPGAWVAVAAAMAETEVALQVLICPLLDKDAGSPQHITPVAQATLSIAAVDAFLIDHDMPDLFPEFPGPQRTLIISGEHDVLRPSARRFAERCEAGGGEVTYLEVPRQLHGFFSVLSLPLGELAFQRVVRAVRSLAVPKIPRDGDVTPSPGRERLRASSPAEGVSAL